MRGWPCAALARHSAEDVGPDARLPRTLFTDRGTGLYNARGAAVRAYSAAVKAAGFKLFWGDDASQQSPDMPDLLLHETAVAWFRRKLSKQRPTCVPWEETQDSGRQELGRW